jgi:serine/threonine protein kinase/tetratricopeptide (TPR) repeat protein
MADEPAREEHANPALAETAADTGSDPVRALHPGDQLGRYTILETMGVGGMGVVYAAHDRDLDRAVAIKLLRTSSDADLARARLLREARAMARLRHPNVVTVYEAGAIGERVFVAMELVEGATIGEWLAAGGRPRTWREVLRVYLAAGRGLAEAHAAGLVHRDFKPSNVLVDRDGRVVVTDFGLARQAGDAAQPVVSATATPGGASPSLSSGGVVSLGGVLASLDAGPAWAGASKGDLDSASGGGPDEHSLTRTGAVLGTPAYMAPEQHRGSLADARSDQFSFCVALYEGLYGHRPFRGHSSASLHAAIVQGRIAPPRKRAGQLVPQRVRRILLRGLRANPDERFPSMPALLAALERVARPWSRPLLVAGGAVLASVAALLIVLGVRDDSAVARDCAASLDGTWDRDVAAGVRAALLRTPGGGDVFAALAARLDAGRRAWLDARADICASERRAPDPWSFHHRMGCLLDYRQQLAALTELVRAADAQVLDFAVSAASELPDPGRCVDLVPEHPRIALDDHPAAPARTDAAERVRAELAQAAAAYQVAKLQRAIDLATSALAGARELGDRRLELAAVFRLAESHAMKADHAIARRYLREATVMAEELDDPEILASSLTLQAALDVYDLSVDPGAVRDMIRRARIAVARMREPDRLLGWLRLIEAYERSSQGHLVEAEAAYADARRIYAEAGLDVKAARADLHWGMFLYQQGRLDESEERLERGLSVIRSQLSVLSQDVVCLLDMAYVAAEILERYGEAMHYREVMLRRCPRAQLDGGPEAPSPGDVMGRVVDEAGRAVAGAEVVGGPGLIGNGLHAQRTRERFYTFSTRTGADGSYTLPARILGEPVLLVADAGAGRSWPVAVGPGPGAPPPLTLRRYGSVRGRVEAPARTRPLHYIAFVPQAGALPYRSNVQVPVHADGTFAVERLPAGRYRVGSSEHEYRLRIVRTMRWVPLGEVEIVAGEALEVSFAMPEERAAAAEEDALEIHVHNRFEGLIQRAHLLVFPGRVVPASMSELEAAWRGGATAFSFAEATPEAGHGVAGSEHGGLWHRFTGLPAGDLVACAVPLSNEAVFQPELGYPPHLDVYCVAVPAAQRRQPRPLVIEAAPMRRRS